jgi:hypothetical protein
MADSPCVQTFKSAVIAHSIKNGCQDAPRTKPLPVQTCPPQAECPNWEESKKLLCSIFCCCLKAPNTSSPESDRNLYQSCVARTLQEADRELGFHSIYKAEISFSMQGPNQQQTWPFMHQVDGQSTTEPSHYWQGRARTEIEGYRPGEGHVRRPDVVIVRDPYMPPFPSLKKNGVIIGPSNICKVVEMKFPGDYLSVDQETAYLQIAEKSENFIVLDEGKCDCGKKKKQESEATQNQSALDRLLDSLKQPMSPWLYPPWDPRHPNNQGGRGFPPVPVPIPIPGRLPIPR